MLDNILLLRSLLIKRTDCLTKTQILFVLLAIRHLNKIKDRTNYVSIFYFLKRARRTITIASINPLLATLTDAGYITKYKTTIKITLLGQQVLNDLDKKCKQARYKYGKKKIATGPKPDKPKPII